METALKLLLRERNLGDAVLALEAIGVKGLETLEILEGAEIDVMVEKHGLPLMTGKLLKKELPSLKPELGQKRKEVEEEQTRMKAEPEEVKRKEVEQEQNRGKAGEEERKRKEAEGERKSRGEAEHAVRKRRKVKQKSVFLVIHNGEPQKRWSLSNFHAKLDTQIVGAYSSLAQAKRCAMHYVEETFSDYLSEWDYADDEWVDDENEDINIRRVVRLMLRGVDWKGEGWFKDCEGCEYEPNQRVTVKEHILDEPQYGSSDSDEEEVVVTTGEKEEGVN